MNTIKYNKYISASLSLVWWQLWGRSYPWFCCSGPYGPDAPVRGQQGKEVEGGWCPSGCFWPGWDNRSDRGQPMISCAVFAGLLTLSSWSATLSLWCLAPSCLMHTTRQVSGPHLCRLPRFPLWSATTVVSSADLTVTFSGWAGLQSDV